MVEQAEVETAGRGTQTGGDGHVRTTRLERPAGMVVGECERHPVVPEHQRQDLAYRDHASGGAAAGHGEHPGQPLPVIGDEHKKPIWPYAVAATAGALVITGLVLWRAGAFERNEGATQQVWTYSGPEPKPMGFRF